MNHQSFFLASAAIIGLSAPLSSTLAQPAEEQPLQAPQSESAYARFLRNVDRFHGIIQSSRETIQEWDSHAFTLRLAMERLWQQHGTGSESDRFACNFAIEMTQVPPWELMGNRTMGDLVQRRYNLTDSQRRQFMESVNRAAMQVFWRNTDAILTIAQEMAVAGGLTGQPEEDGIRLTRWADLGKSICVDVLRFVEAEMPRILEMLDPAQQRLAREDLKTFKRWQAYGDQTVERWLEGKWTYQDLGLSHEMFDPQWLENQRRLQRSAMSQPAATVSTTPNEPTDAWTAYVRAFIRRYQLDASQRQTAASILRELQHCATGYMLSHRLDLQELSRQAASASQDQRLKIERDRTTLLQPIQTMFQELKDRLENLPSAAPRAAATRPASPTSQPAQPRQVPA